VTLNGILTFPHEHDAVGMWTAMVPYAVLVVAVLLAAAYLTAAARTRRRGVWPVRRSACWLAGLAAGSLALVGPIGDGAHADFVAHMTSHVLLGMLAPLLLVRSAPATLALRTLSRDPARRLARLLGSGPVAFLVHPAPASVLNVGGLWLLYGTPLYSAMHSDPLITALVQTHIFITGYLFAAAIVGADPAPHRASYPIRSAWLIAAFAGHGILAKHLFANPPVGVPADRAELGALVMYYGGDAVEVAVVVLLCAGWYRSTRPREARDTRGVAHLRPVQADDYPRSTGPASMATRNREYGYTRRSSPPW
jgi:putative membrane protein